MYSRLGRVKRRLRSVPATAWVGIALATTGAMLDFPYHLLPQSTLSGLGVAWGFTPDDFIFLVTQIGEIGHFMIFAGLFFIVIAYIYDKVMEEERRQLQRES